VSCAPEPSPLKLDICAQSRITARRGSNPAWKISYFVPKFDGQKSAQPGRPHQ
jgi:hypothetical protein